jgi:hypothetical protein
VTPPHTLTCISELRERYASRRQFTVLTTAGFFPVRLMHTCALRNHCAHLIGAAAESTTRCASDYVSVTRTGSARAASRWRHRERRRTTPGGIVTGATGIGTAIAGTGAQRCFRSTDEMALFSVNRQEETPIQNVTLKADALPIELLS